MHLVFSVGSANSDVFSCGNSFCSGLLAHSLDLQVIIRSDTSYGDAEARYIDWSKGVFENDCCGGDCYNLFEDAADRKGDD